MYACLYCAESSAGAGLQALAHQFSPAVERSTEAAVVFSITPLRKLIGSPHQIASAIGRAGDEQKLQANLALAANPDTALLLARNFAGVTLVTPGEERYALGTLPLSALLAQAAPDDYPLLEVLHRWGLKTCEELAALPEKGIAERLGPTGVYLRRLACGTVNRPLRIPAPVTSYQEHVELEHRLELLEPLLFLLARTLGELVGRLRSQARAARLVAARLELEDHAPYRCELEFPVPLADSHTMLKLLQLHLERHPPPAPILAFTLRVEPVEPRRVQGGMFLPPAPPPDKLQLTLARIAGMVGRENVGTPALLDTYRPDAFALQPLPATGDREAIHNPPPPATLHLVVRLFRPALPARVRLLEQAPQTVLADSVKGKVLRSAGPWKTSGEWWAATYWCREEWDVALDDGALYRIYQDGHSRNWFVHGVYD